MVTFNTCQYLAHIGFEFLRNQCGLTESGLVNEGGIFTENLADHIKIREFLLSEPPKARSYDRIGAKWIKLITWPDRVPSLKTWAAQSTLPKIIATHQRRLRESDELDLFSVRSFTKQGEGPSGFDATTCQDPIDIGFSLSEIGMKIELRPAVELLAIIGLETVPLVSFDSHQCGIVHDEKIWRFNIEERAGGYFRRWGDLFLDG